MKPLDKHQGYFHTLATVNNTTIKMEDADFSLRY